ncbi:TonB-dependent receptor [Pyxidicoccus fallax]|uniref:TonB-dependent receptor n=1 Tax=Pyxidicoccus fallax TaxID=394095 RepID=UPI001FE8FA8F|nr:TonB-dependent receptor [Pyxidicoccus fallax]
MKTPFPLTAALLLCCPWPALAQATPGVTPPAATATPPPASSDTASGDGASPGMGAPHSSRPDATPPPAPADDEASPDHMGETISVEGRGRGALISSEVLTSVNVIGREQLAEENVNEPLEVLRRTPAVYMDGFNQGIVSSDIGVRGFSTQGDVAPVKLLIDGIPSNIHIGVPDMKTVSPLDIERMEVVKGTNDPRFGLYNVAGNVNVVTRRGGNERQLRLLGGSFGTVEPQAFIGIENGRLAQNYSAAYRRSSGYRNNSEQGRFTGSGKWFLTLDKGGRVGLIVRGAYMDADAPGYLTTDEMRAAPRSVVDYARADGGTQRNLHASVHFDRDFSPDLTWSLKAYGQGFLRKRWVRHSAESIQQERVEDEKQYGALSVLTLRTDALGLEDFALEWGLDYQLQDNRHLRYQTEERRRSGDPVRNQDFDFQALGTYLQARAWLVDRVRVVAALRADRLFGGFRDRRSGDEYGISDEDLILQPKLSLAYTPWEGHTVYGNYGRTFQTGVGLGAYQTQGEPLSVSLNDGWEAGYKLEPRDWLTARVAVWQQYASNEVRLRFDDSGDSENVGRTRREGFDVELTVRPLTQVTLWGSFSRHVAWQTEPGPAHPARLGKQLDHVPDFSAKTGVDYAPLTALHLSLWLYAQGDYHLTKENDQGQYGAYTLLNLDASYEVTQWARVGVQLRNLLGTTYDTSVWYRDFSGPTVLHTPGDGRAGYVTTTMTF